MYEVSAAYIAKMKSASVKRRRIRGFVDNIPFTENDIMAGSFQYSDIAVNSADIKLGGVFVSTLRLTFLKGFTSQFGRGTWRGRTITASVGLLVDQENDTWEDVPLKPYTIDEANHSEIGIDVTAYDAMAKADTPLNFTTTSGSMYSILAMGCSICGITLGMTEEEVEALPNGAYTLGLHPENDCETWRDIISWLAITAGGFACINRSGALEIRTWKSEADLEIGINDRFAGGNWSDFETYYTALRAQNADGSVTYIAIPQDDGLTMDIGMDPFLQYGTEEVKAAMRQNILQAIQALRYIPFSSTSLIDPALDLGDVILFSNGIANGSTGCVMRIDFSYSKGATIKGYGKNPSLNGARSKQDKAISQAANQSKSQGLTYYTYRSTQAISLTETPQRLYRIAFTAAEETTVELWHEVKWQTEADGDEPVAIKYEYYLDGVKFDYEPEDTWPDGYHTMPHPYWLQEVEGGILHYWEVRASATGGTATADRGDVHALLRGQKLVGEVKFDGNIEITDEFEPFVAGFDIVALSDSISLDTQTPQTISLSDSVTAFVAGFEIVGLADNVRLRTAYVQFNIVSEDGQFNIVSEDGQYNIVSEGGYN